MACRTCKRLGTRFARASNREPEWTVAPSVTRSRPLAVVPEAVVPELWWPPRGVVDEKGQLGKSQLSNTWAGQGLHVVSLFY